MTTVWQNKHTSISPVHSQEEGSESMRFEAPGRADMCCPFQQLGPQGRVTGSLDPWGAGHARVPRPRQSGG